MPEQEEREERRWTLLQAAGAKPTVLSGPSLTRTTEVVIPEQDAERREAELREALTELCDAVPDYTSATLRGHPSDRQRKRLEAAFAQARAALQRKEPDG